jgi:hypothetical protein
MGNSSTDDRLRLPSPSPAAKASVHYISLGLLKLQVQHFRRKYCMKRNVPPFESWRRIDHSNATGVERKNAGDCARSELQSIDRVAGVAPQWVSIAERPVESAQGRSVTAHQDVERLGA